MISLCFIIMYRGIGNENEMLSNWPCNIGKHCFLLTFCHAFINVRLSLPATGYGLKILQM
jgi:hypothetical protein